MATATGASDDSSRTDETSTMWPLPSVVTEACIEHE